MQKKVEKNSMTLVVNLLYNSNNLIPSDYFDDLQVQKGKKPTDFFLAYSELFRVIANLVLISLAFVNKL
jgi:hypothetical protein